MPRIVIINGTEAGKAFEVSAPESVIGRQAGAQILIDGPKVSRRHARVVREGDSFRLEDLGSMNGTLLNGKRLEAPATLNNNDQIGIGPLLLRYEEPQGSAEFTIQARTAANTSNPDLYLGNAAHKLRVILQLSSDLGRSLDVEDLLKRVLDHLFVLFPQAERGLVIFLQDGRFSVRAQKQRSGFVSSPRFSGSIIQKVAAEGVGIFAEDLQTDARFAESQSIMTLGISSFICVPLQTKGGRALGALQLERNDRGRQFTAEDLQLLTTIGLQVSVALDNAQLHQELLSRQRIEQEVALAREIQLSYLPTKLPDLPAHNFELHAELFPAHEISGDFYDYFSLGGDRLALTVADVCGKGIPAALFMSMVRALLENLAQRESNPGVILRELNNAIARQNPKCQFVTMCLCVFDPGSRTIELSSGGHPPPLMRRHNGTVESLSIEHGPLLGFADHPEPYPKRRYQLEPGDLLLLYTDGVPEAPAPDGQMFGAERLRATLAETPFPPRLTQWTHSLRQAIQGFTGKREQEDDITLALLRVVS